MQIVSKHEYKMEAGCQTWRPSRVAPRPHRLRELFRSSRADTCSRDTLPSEKDCLANLKQHVYKFITGS